MTPGTLAEHLSQASVLEDLEFSDLPWPAREVEAPLVLRRLRFERVDFSAANLTGARLEECIFAGCDLRRVRLDEATLEGCRFYDPDLGAGCAFDYAQLEGARFEHCDLSLCDLTGAHCWNLELVDCTAQGLVLDRTDFSRHPSRNLTLTAFTAHRCNLAFAAVSRVMLAGADLSGSRLREAVLDDVVLRDASLEGCDLSGVTARNLELAGADLRDAQLEGLDPKRIDLRGVRIRSWQQQALLEAMGLRVED